MTTASVLLTVGTTWSANSDKQEKEDKPKLVRNFNFAALAARELRESTATREQALRIMKEWIAQNNDIKNVRTDDLFLLRFLRHKKFSIPMSQQTLLKYLGLRKFYPEIFLNLDCDEGKLEELIDCGYMMVSPMRDAKGRRVIVYNMDKFNAAKMTCWDMCRVHAAIYEALLEDPADQICGFTHVGGGNGVTGSHITVWNPTDFARLMKWGEQSMPMRHKEFHLVNIPSALKYIIDFAASKASPKISDRIYLHTNLKQLHKKMDTACLPTTYGGDIAPQDMISFTKQILSDQKKKLLGLDEMTILSTRGIISTRKKNSGMNEDGVSVTGSFRKLEID